MAPHNLWIEGPHFARQGEEVTCRVFFGHHFHPEGNLDPAALDVWLAPPREEKISLMPRMNGDGISVQFVPHTSGTYTVMAAYQAGVWSITRDGQHLPGDRKNYPGLPVLRTVLFHHFAKTVVPVDREVMWPGSFGLDLEIVPLSYLKGELELLVQYRGRPLRGAKIYAQNREEERSRIGRTDTDGKTLMLLPPGDWMIIAHAQDRPVGNAAGYDERLLTAVLTFHG